MIPSVFELRQYTLHPGRRDELIDLFERRFVESQEAAGMRIVGTFRDLDGPDRFVWIRAFADMPARRDALGAFYGGPVWRANRDAANATLVDSDDVLLLRPAGAGPTFPASRPRPAALPEPEPEPGPGPAAVPEPEPGPGPAAGVGGPGRSLVAAAVYPLAPGDGDAIGYLEAEVRPALQRLLGVPVYALRTEPAENTYPALPVRADEHVYVWVAAVADEAAYRRGLARLDADPRWIDEIRPRLDKLLTGPIQQLRLQPTARSALR